MAHKYHPAMKFWIINQLLDLFDQGWLTENQLGEALEAAHPITVIG